MRIRISHRTDYSYDKPLKYALQRLRLFPKPGPLQSVLNWDVKLTGAVKEAAFCDQYSNDTWLISASGEPHGICVEASGEVETHDLAGVQGAHSGFAPLWLFRRETPLTLPGDRVRALAAKAAKGAPLDRLHDLNSAVHTTLAYIEGATEVTTSAEDALALGHGVCQDHSHVFISAAHVMGFPARYVSGYLMRNDVVEQTASHAWAEAHVDGIGWVGFDAANGQSPDGRYIRLATGLDYREAMPSSGIVFGGVREALAVHVTVEQ